METSHIIIFSRSLTDQVPFSALLVVRQIDAVVHLRHVDFAGVVRPGAELHPAKLVVEREPLDVDPAGRDVESQRDPGAHAV